MVSTHASFFADGGYKGARYTDTAYKQKFKQFSPVVIGNDVWVGQNAIIKEGGVTIGDGAIVGAGAVYF